MAIDKLNSLQFLFLRPDYFKEFGDRDGVYVDYVPFELRTRLLRLTWPTTIRDRYFFTHDGRDVITREGWEEFVRWVCLAMDRQLGAESGANEAAMKHKQIPAGGEPSGTIDDFFHVIEGSVKPEKPVTIEEMNDVTAAGWAGELGTENNGAPMSVADLIAKLHPLPPDLPVMLTVSEGGIDYARVVRIADVAQHHRNWSFTPIGQYRELPDENTVGEPFKAVVIDLDAELL